MPVKTLVIVGIIVTLSSAAVRSEERPVRIGIAYDGSRQLAIEWVRTFNSGNSSIRQVAYDECNFGSGIPRLADRQYDLLIKEGRTLTDMERLWLVWKCGDDTEATDIVVVGEVKVSVLVNSDYPRSYVDMAQLRRQSMGGNKQADTNERSMHVYGGALESWPMQLVKDRVLATSFRDDKYPVTFGPLRSDFQKCLNDQAIIEQVRSDRIGIGFIMGVVAKVAGVKTLGIGENATSAKLPSIEPVLQDDYPLTETLVVCIRRDAPESARKLVAFMAGEEGSKIADKYGITTAWMAQRYSGQLRLKEAKAGKGERLSITGIPGGLVLIQDETIDYIKTKAPVQTQYFPADADTTSVGMFVSGPASGDDKATPVRELLLLDDRPGDQAMKVHGDKWNALNPREYMLAGRAVAIVVPAASKLQSLTLEQVKAIFSGQVKEWKLLGVGSGAGGGGAEGAAPGKINCYGVQDIKGEPVSLSAAIAAAMPTTAPASGATGVSPVGAASPSASQAGTLFRREVAGMAGVSIKKDTAEACSAVSTDPNGIAFVDLAAIPEKGQSVKIIAIGDLDKAVVPSPDTIKNATYPLSQRLYLYVHPKAGDTAKDFAKFVGTCGQSEASPYTDTVKSVAKTYYKNGLVPLAEPAEAQLGKAGLPTTLPAATTMPAGRS
jgi:ABC-type phosphate transport system substrate-binding protein